MSGGKAVLESGRPRHSDALKGRRERPGQTQQVLDETAEEDAGGQNMENSIDPNQPSERPSNRPEQTTYPRPSGG